jgi:hypothetical protein
VATLCSSLPSPPPGSREAAAERCVAAYMWVWCIVCIRAEQSPLDLRSGGGRARTARSLGACGDGGARGAVCRRSLHGCSVACSFSSAPSAAAGSRSSRQQISASPGAHATAVQAQSATWRWTTPAVQPLRKSVERNERAL